MFSSPNIQTIMNVYLRYLHVHYLGNNIAISPERDILNRPEISSAYLAALGIRKNRPNHLSHYILL